METRLATIDDLDIVANLFDAYRQFYEQAADLARAKSFIGDRLQRGDAVICVALNAVREVVGFCQLYPVFCSIEAKPIYLLSDLFVQPQARQSGVARALLLAAEQLCVEHGKTKMELTTAKTNFAAQSAYESLGWVRDEVFLTYSKRIAA